MSFAYAPLRHYQLLRQIGGGGTGVTYQARDTRTSREVAVKTIRLDEAFRENEALAGRLKQRFDEHMRTVMRLVHPRIAPVLDFGLEQNQDALYAFVALPYFPAGSLADWLSQPHQRASFSPALVLSFVAQAADVLSYAHECGVLHQDIKPANILLSAPSAQTSGLPDFQLADFGLAAFFAAHSSQGLSQSNYVRGISAYLAPEKWEGQAFPASDQYSLAILAFSLLTGALPFQGTPGQMIFQHREVPPPALSRLNPRLDPAFDAIFARALAKNPAQRFPSVRAFGQELARLRVVVGGQPGFQPPLSSSAPLRTLPPIVSGQTPAQPFSPGPLASPPAPPAQLAAVPPFPAYAHPPVTMPPQMASAPVTRPVLPAQIAKQSTTPAAPQQTPPTSLQQPVPDQADPDATLIGRPSRALAEADPDATLSPTPSSALQDQSSPAKVNPEASLAPELPPTPPPAKADPEPSSAPAAPPLSQASLADADPDATLIGRPLLPLTRPDPGNDAGNPSAIQADPQPQNGVERSENASYAAPTPSAPAGFPQPGAQTPPVSPPPGYVAPPTIYAVPPAPASSPQSGAQTPPAPPVRRPPAPGRNIFQTGKTLLLLVLALVILTGGSLLLWRSLASTPTATSAGLTSVLPTQQNTVQPVEHVVNPYAGAQGFLNPTWVATVKAAAKRTGGTLGEKEARVAQYSTAVWLTSITSVTGGTHASRGLAGVLDASETQAAESKQPIVVTLALADLPDRNCTSATSNNTQPLESRIRGYESSYIDVIARIIGQARYRNLRVVTIVEPGILANLATAPQGSRCRTNSQAYIAGLQYALNQLHALPNVYTYLDIAHPDWLGWKDHFNFTVSLMSTVARGTTAGFKSIDGFIGNIGNYVPTSEPYLTANQRVGGKLVRTARFYAGNPYLDMFSYASAMRQALIASGFPPSIGMLIDTARNGWGGPGRPTGPSASHDLNTFVNASRIDRRPRRNDWCNQAGGIGARPQADPLAGIAAFVWITWPGTSDGTGSLIPKGPQNPTGQSPNPMCAPTSAGQPTGAIPGAPVAGSWFQALFNTLVQNAYPPL